LIRTAPHASGCGAVVVVPGLGADRVGAVPQSNHDEIKRILNRPYYYAYSRSGKTIYAYTKEEWGIGASSGSADYNLIRSFYFSLAITLLVFLPATLGCVVLMIAGLFGMPLMTLIFLFFGAVFGLGLVQGYFNITEEWRGRKLRKLRGLPKPWWIADDDRAFQWFLRNPTPHIDMTEEYFPMRRASIH
jgi:hypothetical protein